MRWRSLGGGTKVVFADFANASIASHTHTVTSKIFRYPPEILKHQPTVMTEEANIWMLAYILITVWYPTSLRIDDDLGISLRNDEEHALFLGKISFMEPAVFPLLARMLGWDPRGRPTAQEALENECFKGSPDDDVDE